MPPRVMLALLVSILIWGSTWTAIRYQLGVTQPGWSIGFRFAIAAAAMALYAVARGLSLRIRRDDLPLLAAIGISQFLLNFQFIYHAEALITSGLVAMIFALLIVPNAIFGRIFLGQRVSGAFVAGVLLAAAGMVLLFHHEIASAAAGGGRAALGILLVCAGTLSASVGNVLQATARAHRLPWTALLTWSMALGAAASMMLALAGSGWPALDARPEYWIATAYLGLFGSAITFPVYLYAIRMIGPARAAYASVLVPIVAMAFSTMLEGYRWTPAAAAGAALALAGMVFALRGRASRG